MSPRDPRYPINHPAFRTTASRRQLIAGVGATAGLAALGVNRLPSAFAQDKVNLQFWTPGGSTTFCDGFTEIGAAYEAVVGNVHIESVTCGVGDQNFDEMFLASIASGTPPDATIVWSSPIAYAVRGALEPLDEWMTGSRYSQVENWPASILASCQFGGKTYGLPVAAGTYAMVYNQELFDEVGLSSARDDFPKTWDELRAASVKITQWDGDNLVRMGMMPPRQPVEFPIWVATNGGKIFDPETMKYTLDSPEAVETLTWMVDWLDTEYKGDMVQVDLANNWTENVVEGRPPAFQAGLLGMQGNGFWITGEFYNQVAPDDPKVTRWDVASYPVGPSGTTTASSSWPNWAVVPSGSKHAEDAFGYIDYVGGPEGMEIWFSKIPDLPTNAKVPDMLPPTLEAKRGKEEATSIVQFFKNQLKVAIPQWTSPVENFANDTLQRTIDQAYAHAGSPADLLADAQKACQAELDKVLASQS
ncbi:MAG: extracellular solute-binding protein [Thermomicrobiales bacterium]